MSKLICLIGAGFSRNADYPSGNELNQHFFENMENRMLRMGSGEWMWDEYDDATSNNGRLNSEYLNTSYLLSEFVEQYQKEFSKVFNYEEFYDFLKDRYGNQELIEELSQKANERLKKDFKIDDSSSHIIKEPDINHYNRVVESFNYLIGDLLSRSYNRAEKKDLFKNFITYIQKYDEVHIFSLNHDLLIEYLLSENKVPFSDGFGVNESPIRGEKDEILKIFNNTYTERIRLYKLHGSVDYYRFDEMLTEGSIYRPTGKYWFFKPEGYYNKHYAKRVNVDTNEVVQKFNFNTVPQFLTGKHKMDFVSSQHFYKELYGTFTECFQKCDELLVVGFSFADIHINAVIKSFIDKYDFKIVNVNPGMRFPFRKNYTTNMAVQLNSLEELE